MELPKAAPLSQLSFIFSFFLVMFVYHNYIKKVDCIII